jgi:hypothetical protein
MKTLLPIMSGVLPWLAAFIFGTVLFFVGKYLQVGEKKRRLEKRRWEEQFTHRSGPAVRAQRPHPQSEPPLTGIGGTRGQGQYRH